MKGSEEEICLLIEARTNSNNAVSHTRHTAHVNDREIGMQSRSKKNPFPAPD